MTATDTDNKQVTWQVFLPSAGGWLFLLLLAGFLFFRPDMLLWDGGIIRHLVIGETLVNEHKLLTTNYPSAFFSNTPCVTNAVVGDLIIGLFNAAGKLNGLILSISIAIALSVTWSYQLARARGMGAIAGPLLAVMVVASSSMHWTARPLIFSHLTLLALYYVLFMSSSGRLKRLFLSTILLMLWSNLHSSAMLGLMMVGAKLAGDMLELLYAGKSTDQADRKAEIKWDLMAITAGAIAVCINARGFEFYTYVFGYLSHPLVFGQSDEWRSLDFSLGLQTWSFLALYFTLVALWLLSGSRPRAGEFLLITILFVGGLEAMRIAPYFTLLCLPLMGPAWKQFRSNCLQTDFKNKTWFNSTLLSFFKLEERVESQEASLPGSLPFAYIVVTLIASLIFLFTPGLKVKDFNSKRLPVAAANYIQEKELSGLGFIKDNWAGYIYWRFRRPIFLDDWMDFYPVSFLQEYIATMSGEPVWQNVLDKYAIEYVLIPRSTLLGERLNCSPNWQLEYQDDLCKLYTRADQSSKKELPANKPMPSSKLEIDSGKKNS